MTATYHILQSIPSTNQRRKANFHLIFYHRRQPIQPMYVTLGERIKLKNWKRSTYIAYTGDGWGHWTHRSINDIRRRWGCVIRFNDGSDIQLLFVVGSYREIDRFLFPRWLIIIIIIARSVVHPLYRLWRDTTNSSGLSLFYTTKSLFVIVFPDFAKNITRRHIIEMAAGNCQS